MQALALDHARRSQTHHRSAPTGSNRTGFAGTFEACWLRDQRFLTGTSGTTGTPLISLGFSVPFQPVATGTTGTLIFVVVRSRSVRLSGVEKMLT